MKLKLKMNYFIIVLFAFIGNVLGALRFNAPSGEIPILKQNSEINPDGSYSYEYETGNGISASESGIGGVSAQGSADWIAPDGTHVFFQYTADENGYQPSGSHVPQIPPLIAKALEWIRTHPSPEYKN